MNNTKPEEKCILYKGYLNYVYESFSNVRSSSSNEVITTTKSTVFQLFNLVN